MITDTVVASETTPLGGKALKMMQNNIKTILILKGGKLVESIR